MSGRNYLRDKVIVIVLNLSGIFLLDIFLHMIDVGNMEIIMITCIWLVVLTLFFLLDFYKKQQYLKEADEILDSLDQKYLLAEVMNKPKTAESKAYYSFLKRSSKSMIEQVTAAKTRQKDYEEYIEQWVHEVKVPITSAKLMCENNKNEITRKILSELERIDHNVESALYFARSETVENDYIIHNMILSEVVADVITRNKQLLMRNQIRIETDNLGVQVLSDPKWSGFIVNQILSNSIKYKSEKPLIRIFSYEEQNKVVLSIEDNGIGIKESEIGRIFQKGFTGTNGREESKSTGIGLYLCGKLCAKLGMEIRAESEPGAGTRIDLIFPSK